jgi:hypothetical protein
MAGKSFNAMSWPPVVCSSEEPGNDLGGSGGPVGVEQLQFWPGIHVRMPGGFWLACTIPGVVALVVAVIPSRLPAATGGELPGAAQQDLLDHYCRGCDDYEHNAGGVEFEVFDPAAAPEDAALAERMLRKLPAGMMPPAGKPRPDVASVQALAAALVTDVHAHAQPAVHPGFFRYQGRSFR